MISVKYIPQSEQIQSITKVGDSKLKMIKNNSLPHKQNRKLSQNSKKFVKDIITREGFRLLKWIMNCFF